MFIHFNWQLENNIVRVFAKFRAQGKATIRLKHPELDIMISKANGSQLNAFLEALFVVHTRPQDMKGLPGVSMLMLHTTTKVRGFSSPSPTSSSSLPFPPPPPAPLILLPGLNLAGR